MDTWVLEGEGSSGEVRYRMSIAEWPTPGFAATNSIKGRSKCVTLPCRQGDARIVGHFVVVALQRFRERV